MLAGEANLLQVSVNILGELPEEHAEEVGQQRSSKIQSLLSEMVTIIEVSPLHSSEE